MPRRFWLALLGLSCCGHPASVQECEVIVERIAELEIQQRTTIKDHELLNREVGETKKSLRGSTMKDCVGRRITNKAMRCVREAKNSKHIVEDCFD